MIGFLFRKFLYDLWDNLLPLLLVNVGFILLVAGAIVAPSLLQVIPALSVAVMVVFVLALGVYAVATALSVKRISDYGGFGFADFFGNLRRGLLAGLLLGGFLLLALLLVLVALPYYAALKTMWGLLIMAALFWTLLVSVVALQWYPAIRARLDSKLRKVTRKSFVIFFDNTGFSVLVFIAGVVLVALSSFLAFLLPGLAGVLLLQDEALRLRLYKYDYLEAHPEADRKKIPWGELLTEDRESTGRRSLRSFLFPWKD